MAGMVSLSVLSFGPLAAPLSALSSLGMLKLPGSALFVAVLFRLPASKKDAMSATPAAIMVRLRIKENMVLVCRLSINLGDCSTRLAQLPVAGITERARRADRRAPPT